MKSILITTKTFCCLATIVFFNVSFAQNYALEERVKQSDIVIEGEVIKAEGFSVDSVAIYTSAIVRISKIFKGNISDSTIEVVLIGGRYGDIASAVSDFFSAGKGL
jgi:hypothetical protein